MKQRELKLRFAEQVDLLRGGEKNRETFLRIVQADDVSELEEDQAV